MKGCKFKSFGNGKVEVHIFPVPLLFSCVLYGKYSYLSIFLYYIRAEFNYNLAMIYIMIRIESLYMKFFYYRKENRGKFSI